MWVVLQLASYSCRYSGVRTGSGLWYNPKEKFAAYNDVNNKIYDE